MSVRTIACLPVIALVAACFLAASCISTSAGDASYRNGTVFITIASPAGPEDAYVQVTVNQMKSLHQEEVAVFGAPVNLTEGENVVSVPGQIGPGQYKLYIYVLQNGERKTAVIRDITV